MRLKCTIMLLILLPWALCGQKIISGKVVDRANGEPIIGASVYATENIISSETDTDGIIESTMIGAATDIDGNFSFDAPQELTSISVSYLGYATAKVDIRTSHTDLLIQIEEVSETFDEVVITGYQKIEKRKATSAVAKIESADLNRAGVANVDQMLSGQISGIVVKPTTGAPGAPVKIQIRGTSTLNGTSDPLWVLDGIPLDGDDIPKNFSDKDNIDDLRSFAIGGLSPQDIESITVLKDASATSIYGARAANGVIVITTKKGKKGAMRTSFNASTFVTQRPNFAKLGLMNAQQKVDFELFLASRADLNYQPHRGEVARILNRYDDYDTYQKKGIDAISPEARSAIAALRSRPSTDWGKELYQSAINQQYGLSFSGGSDVHNYYVSGVFFDEKGTTKGTGLNRLNITLKNSFIIKERLTVGISLFGNRNNNSSYITGIDAYTNPSYYTRRANPYLPVLDANENYVYDPDLIERSDLNLKYNHLEEKANTQYRLTSNSIKPMFDMGYRFNDRLKIYTQLGTQFDFNTTERLANENSYYKRKYRQRSRYSDGQGGYRYFLPDGGIIQNWNTNTFQYNWKNTLNYNSPILERGELDVMLGTELRRNKRTQVHTKGFGYDANTLTTVAITDPRAAGSSSFETYRKQYVENAYASFFSTASYTHDRKYTLFGSLRYDGSNLFGVDPKYRYLPLWSIAGTWNVKKEGFMADVDAIHSLKLRASYGVQGNIDKSTSPFVIGEYRKERILPNSNEDLIRVLSAPNKKLRWEKTTSSNIGFDLGILENKLRFTVDAYYRKSTDLIGLKATPLESGFNFINTNWATISNKGVELSIYSQNIETDAFTWSTALNIAHNTNRVDRIEIRENSFKPSLQGYGVNAIFALKTAGFDSNGLPLFWKDGKKVTAVDFYRLSDGVDGSQLSRAQHRDLYTYVGDGDPLLSGGLLNMFRYKDFDLRIATNFSLLQTVKQTPQYNPTLVDPGRNYSTDIIKAGNGNLPGLIGKTTPGFDTDLVYTWYHTYDDAKTYRDLDIWVKDISYLRINSIRLGYNLPKTTLPQLNFSQLSLSLEGRNLFVIGSNHHGYFDPETYGSSYAQPIPRSIALGLNASF